MTEFRDATRDDVPEIVRLLADDPIGATRDRYEEPLPDRYWDAFDAVEASPDNELIVGDNDGEIVACLQITYIPQLNRLGAARAQIEGVRVATEVRGEGLGEALIMEAIERAQARGCEIVQLTSDKERGDAHRFYDRLGFRATHEGMKLVL